MRHFAILTLATSLFVLPLLADTSKIASVEPDSAKAGDVVKATGEGLAKASVSAVFLTNGTDDLKTVIVEQTDTSVSFKVPANIKAGRWAVMLQLKDGMLLEQPVKVTIE